MIEGEAAAPAFVGSSLEDRHQEDGPARSWCLLTHTHTHLLALRAKEQRLQRN